MFFQHHGLLLLPLAIEGLSRWCHIHPAVQSGRNRHCCAKPKLTNETEKGGRTLLHNAHAHSHHITNTKMSRFFLCNCSSTHTLRGEHLPPVDRKTHKWHNIFNIFSILLCPGVSLLERCSKMVLGVSQVVANALEIVFSGTAESCGLHASRRHGRPHAARANVYTGSL